MKIKIDMEKFISEIPAKDYGDKEQKIADETDISKFIIDSLNSAGLEAEYIFHDYDYYVSLLGHKVPLEPIMKDSPEQSLLDTLRYFVCEVSSLEGWECSLTYARGQYSILLEEKKLITGTEENEPMTEDQEGQEENQELEVQ